MSVYKFCLTIQNGDSWIIPLFTLFKIHLIFFENLYVCCMMYTMCMPVEVWRPGVGPGSRDTGFCEQPDVSPGTKLSSLEVLSVTQPSQSVLTHSPRS